MLTQKEIKELITDFFYEDYENMVFTSQLYEMFGKHIEGIEEYIKEGREFWFYNIDKLCYQKLKVTYVRSGVMFFVYEGETEEHAWFISSFNCGSLYAAHIYPYEIGKILSRWYDGADEEFPEICKKCKWNDCDGRIKVDVIWEEK